MKSGFKILGISILAALIVFSMAGCKDDPEPIYEGGMFQITVANFETVMGAYNNDKNVHSLENLPRDQANEVYQLLFAQRIPNTDKDSNNVTITEMRAELLGAGVSQGLVNTIITRLQATGFVFAGGPYGEGGTKYGICGAQRL